MRARKLEAENIKLKHRLLLIAEELRWKARTIDELLGSL